MMDNCKPLLLGSKKAADQRGVFNNPLEARTMKLFIALLVSCTSVLGADTGIHVTTQTSTSGFSNWVAFVTNTISDGPAHYGTNATTYPLPRGYGQLFIQNKEVFTRDGQTNLVRFTESTNGRTVIWSKHVFYHDGKQVGDCIDSAPGSLQFGSAAGSPYSIRIISVSNNVPDSVIIQDKAGHYVDLFRCTNGLFYPVENKVIKDYNYWSQIQD